MVDVPLPPNLNANLGASMHRISMQTYEWHLFGPNTRVSTVTLCTGRVDKRDSVDVGKDCIPQYRYMN